MIPRLLGTNNVLKDTIINSLVETELVFQDTSNSLLGSNEVVSRRLTVSSQAAQTYVVCVSNMDKLGWVVESDAIWHSYEPLHLKTRLSN